MLDEIEAVEDLRELGVEMSGIVEAEAGDGCGGCSSSSSSIFINSCSSIELSRHVSLFYFLPLAVGRAFLCRYRYRKGGSSSNLIVVAVIHFLGAGRGRGSSELGG